jgi:hypothetical protein
LAQIPSPPTNLSAALNYAPPESEQWKAELARASRSVLISVTNTTQRLLEKVEHQLLSGIWRKEPPKFIQPGRCVEFGSGRWKWMK